MALPREEVVELLVGRVVEGASLSCDACEKWCGSFVDTLPCEACMCDVVGGLSLCTVVVW